MSVGCHCFPFDGSKTWLLFRCTPVLTNLGYLFKGLACFAISCRYSELKSEIARSANSGLSMAAFKHMLTNYGKWTILCTVRTTNISERAERQLLIFHLRSGNRVVDRLVLLRQPPIYLPSHRERGPLQLVEANERDFDGHRTFSETTCSVPLLNELFGCN